MMKPLDGLRVLDLTRVMAGPFCTDLLADLGAEVIKPEPPQGDDYRHIGPFVQGESALLTQMNRGKQSIVLDLKDAQAQETVRNFALHCDVIVKNFRSGAAARLGLGPQLREEKPALIYASIAGFGQSGPAAHLPAYDLVAQAMSGQMAATGEDGGAPLKVGESYGDLVAGLYASWSILAALHQRDCTGQGATLDIAMFDALFSLLPTSHAVQFHAGTTPQRVGNRHPLPTPFGCFATSDCQAVIAVLGDRQWQALCTLIGQPQAETDPRSLSDEGRTAQESQIKAMIEAWSHSQPTAQVITALTAAGIPTALIQTPETALKFRSPPPPSSGPMVPPFWRGWGHQMADMFPMLTEEERALVVILATFCAKEVAPKAAETDQNATFVAAQLHAMAQKGMMGANLHDPYGPGISAHALLRAVEVVAEACGSTVSALTAHYLATDSIALGGDTALQARYLPSAAAGTTLGAVALTEPGAGSDPADMQTSAMPEGGGYRSKGRKCVISNGGVADFLVAHAVTDPAAGHRGISAFVVDEGTPGLVPGRVERTMGLKGGHVWKLDLDLWVPTENRLGSLGTGFRTAIKVLDNGRLEVAAMCIGIAQQAIDLAINWAKTRIIGSEPLAARQGIRWQPADMATDQRAARLLALEAARQRQLGERFSGAASMAKLHASEMAHRVTDGALQIHGGYGFTRDFPLERPARDVRIMRIYEGSSEIQRNIIAAHILN